MIEANSDDGEGRLREENFRGRGKCLRSGIGGLECSSPARLAVNRLLAVVRKCRVRKRAPLEKERHCSSWRRENVDALVEVVRHRSPERMPEDSRRNDASEGQRQEATFNLALGVGLLSLIAASKTELDKTIELRKQLEALLRSIKEECQNIGTTPKLSDDGVVYAASNTPDGLSNVSPYSIDDHALSLSQPESGMSFLCDKDDDMHGKEGFLEGMDHLEEELAAELEILQLHIESENSSQNQEVAEISSTDIRSESVSESSGEVIDVDVQDEEETQYCGVSPLELERRLHELLQMRQVERIKELEAHLTCFKKRLHEKEAEVSWWKDTAKLISKQLPQSSSSQFWR